MIVLQCRCKTTQLVLSRMYSQKVRETDWSKYQARRQSYAEPAVKPSAPRTPLTLGRGVAGGAAAFGIGALCYYGLTFNNQAGIFEQSTLLPQNVREKVRDTYLYFGSSLVVSAAAAVVTFKNLNASSVVSKTTLVTVGLALAAMMGTGLYTMSLDYAPTFNVKHIGWFLHSCFVGAAIAPAALMGGAPVIQAMLYATVVLGSLTAIAACAPNNEFMYKLGPIAACLGFVCVSTLATSFIPTSKALISGRFATGFLFSGLIIFSAMFLFDTQRVVEMAETFPANSPKPFDPINASISIYMDTPNMFIRLVQVYEGSEGKK